MPYVLLCSNGKNTNLYESITTALTGYGGIQNYSHDSIYTTSEKPLFCFSSSLSMPRTQNIKGVIIFDDSFKSCAKKQVNNCLIPVIHSQNRKAIAQLKDTNCVAITCGTSSKDTLSLASIKNKSATISLQRELFDIYGTCIEPMDFTVTLQKERGVYPTLAACAALLLCGIDPSDGYCF